LNTWRWIDLRSLGVVDSLVFTFTSSDVGMYGMNTPAYVAIDHFNEPLYDAAVKNGGTKALYKDSIVFKSWAKSCTVIRGYQNIDNKVLGLATSGVDINGTLKAGINPTVSLGDSGVAILEFPIPVKNGNGPDFAVFENGFDSGSNQFLELAFVEVSSDGIHYVRFPAVSKTNAFTQTGTFGSTDASLLYNFAGKYVANYGTPFDLEDLKNNPLLDLNNITHIKLVDVIGKIDLKTSSKDSLGNPVNDPFTTAFISSGFDLDAIGVINQNELATGLISRNANSNLHVYPNPSNGTFHISLNTNEYLGQTMEIFDTNGMVTYNQEVSLTTEVDASAWKNGIYYIRIGDISQKLIKIQ
ncbi:MAG: DUF4465 domain-containing protein, partial [Cytophagales bacterium]|nr:DUF4465 domain-containing protein [Cytophaga sp.]